ncbi:exopolysaccharide biosynthesis protein [Sphingomonas sp. DBB INV C78]
MSFLNDFTADDPDRGLRVLAEPAAPARPESELLGRALDISVAALILLAVLPVFLILCLAIWAHDGGAPIFMHRRIGRGGKMFPCLKLRTMVVDSEQRLQDLLKSDPAAAFEWHVSQKLRNDPRITPLGAFLRKSSLDELPQLINVLFGQMSLVGPRPIVMAEATRYGRYFKFYCAVRPGITGLWQVSGRNDVSYRRRVALDTLYARSRSVAMDLAILTRTVPAVLSARGCS